MKLNILMQALVGCGLLTLIIVSGCKISEDDKGNVVQVTPEFRLDLFEKAGSSRAFQIELSSIENQLCLNYQVDYRLVQQNKHISLSLRNIVAPVDCQPGQASAKSTAWVGTLQNGVYELEINLKDVIINKGTLSVSDDAIKVEMESEDGIEWVHKELRRIPARLVWGYTGYQDSNEVGSLPDDFLTALNDAAQPALLSKGYYGYFTIGNNSEMILRETPGFLFFKPVGVRWQKEIPVLSELLETFRSAPNGDKMTIQLKTWDGQDL